VLFPAVRHEVSFWYQHDRLSGDLRMPGVAGPHPVILVVRPPEDPQRDYSPWLDALAGAGFASFSWDRPTPGPGPEDPSRLVPHQAREVLAAVDRLCCQPDLDPAAVALMGWGEGGWAAAQAATYSDRIAALVLACTPAGAEGAPHDPRPTLSAVSVPVLALFGEQDPLVDLRGSVRGLRTTLRDAGHVDHEVAVLRGADHGLRVRAPHGLGPMIDGRHRFGDWPPALTELLVTWLRQRLRPQEVPTYAPPLHAPSGRPPARSRTMLPPVVPVRQVRRRVPR
jgi:predicted esterase